MAKNRDLGGGTQRRRARLATAWLLPLLLGATPPAWAGETTERVSVGPHGRQADGASLAPALSMDGRFAAFKSDATNLVRGDTNGATDVFVRDRAKSTTERVSVGPGGVQGDGNSGGVFDFDTIAISADGRFVAFVSDATNLVPGDTNFSTDVFVRDRAKGVTERVSVGPGGVQANDVSFFPSLSADGRFVAFQSGATNLVPGDTGGGIYVRDRELGTTERVDLGPGGVQANEAGFDPAISADGRFVAFASVADTFVSGDTNDTTDIFVRAR
jgi:Tol biopolymer transport system component